MLFDLNIHFLTGKNIHDREGSAALTNSIKDLGVAGVIRSVQIAIIDRETISPEVKCPVNSRRALGNSCVGIFHNAAGGFIAAKGARRS